MQNKSQLAQKAFLQKPRRKQARRSRNKRLLVFLVLLITVSLSLLLLIFARDFFFAFLSYILYYLFNMLMSVILLLVCLFGIVIFFLARGVSRAFGYPGSQDDYWRDGPLPRSPRIGQGMYGPWSW